MLAFLRLSLTAAALAAAYSAHAAEILVQVGPPGRQLTFSPSNITANVGDVLTFQFLSRNHSVTQSSFASPCVPKAGGVDSGFQAVIANATDVHEFTIALNDSSKPMFFFSAQTAPASECKQGMVFSINQDPNSAISFAAFQANAEADIPTSTVTVVGPLSTTAVAPATPSSGSEILVQVGPENQLAFSPTNISANVGDVVTFQFLSMNHSVTQTSFANPCEPLAGGINSGFKAVINATIFPSFSFTVDDASTPLLFSSAQTVPASECNNGMVFSINQDPNSVESFAAFQAKADPDLLPPAQVNKQARRAHARDFASAAEVHGTQLLDGD
ncbi:hypothetical protein B0H19DRAFT_1085449 [Mycena capillaripes]|nr:hypothetical protein B0H19DRAFT_1085449 [Mycena capillaripes]